MATTHLTDVEAHQLTLADLFRRVRADEEIGVENKSRTAIVLKPSTPPTDNSLDATIDWLENLEKLRGQPLRMGTDFADDMEKIIALRKLRDTSAWD